MHLLLGMELLECFLYFIFLKLIMHLMNGCFQINFFGFTVWILIKVTGNTKFRVPHVSVLHSLFEFLEINEPIYCLLKSHEKMKYSSHFVKLEI